MVSTYSLCRLPKKRSTESPAIAKQVVNLDHNQFYHPTFVGFPSADNSKLQFIEFSFACNIASASHFINHERIFQVAHFTTSTFVSLSSYSDRFLFFTSGSFHYPVIPEVTFLKTFLKRSHTRWHRAKYPLQPALFEKIKTKFILCFIKSFLLHLPPLWAFQS